MMNMVKCPNWYCLSLSRSLSHALSYTLPNHQPSCMKSQSPQANHDTSRPKYKITILIPIYTITTIVTIQLLSPGSIPPSQTQSPRIIQISTLHAPIPLSSHQIHTQTPNPTTKILQILFFPTVAPPTLRPRLC